MDVEDIEIDAPRVPFVALVYGIEDVELLSFGKIRQEGGTIVRGTLQNRQLIRHTYDELKVILSETHYPGRRDVYDTTGEEDWGLVTRAERTEPANLPLKCRDDLLKRNLGIDPIRRTEIFARDIALGQGRRLLNEAVEILFLYGETGSVGMAAEVLEEVFGVLQDRIDVIPVDASGRSADKIVLRVCEDDGGTIVLLGETARHDPDDAAVPRRVIHNDDLVILQVCEALDDIIGLLCDETVKVTTLIIVVVEVPAQYVRIFFVA